MSRLTQEQHNILLRPLNGSRVAKRSQAGRQLSYLEAWDVKAHMIRVFGFCNWDSVVSDVRLAFEEKNEKDQWNVGYLVTVTLTVKDEQGRYLCEYAEAAVGSATLPRRGEAHDMAVKTAESDAFKRAAINLGTQFGLSLYNNGATSDVVRATLVGNAPAEAPEAPSEAANAEQATQAQDGGQNASEAVVEALQGMAGIADNAQRILAVAKFKAQHDDALTDLVEIDGQKITISRYADLVAAGHYTDGKE